LINGESGRWNSQQTQKMQGIIMAIPACETVVTATSNIIDSIEDAPYTKQSGVAVGMAMNSGGTTVRNRFSRAFVQSQVQVRRVASTFAAAK
jgi:hypothetical protein